MQIEGVIFDMDGVLIDAREWHYQALNEALAIFGVKIGREEHLEEFDGLPTRVKLAKLEGQGRLPMHLMGTVEAVKQRRTLSVAARNNKPNLSHLLLLGWLRARGIKIGVATNSIRSTAEFMLNGAGLTEYIGALVTNEDVEQAKPSPDIYRAACQRLGLQARYSIAVEDSKHGIQAAKEAGLQVFEVQDPSEVNLGNFMNWLEAEF